MGALTAVPLGEHDELARLRGEVKHLRKTNEILSQGRLGVVNKGIKYHAAHLIMNEMSNGRFNWGKIIPAFPSMMFAAPMAQCSRMRTTTLGYVHLTT